MPKMEPVNAPWELWGNVTRAKHRVLGTVSWEGNTADAAETRRGRGSQGGLRGRGWVGRSPGKQSCPGRSTGMLGQLRSFCVFKATECSLHIKPTLEIQYEKCVRPAPEGAPQGGPTRVSMGHRHRRARKREVPDEGGASPRGSAPPAAVLGPCWLPPALPFQTTHSQQSAPASLMCIQRRKNKQKIRIKKGKTKIWNM